MAQGKGFFESLPSLKSIVYVSIITVILINIITVFLKGIGLVHSDVKFGSLITLLAIGAVIFALFTLVFELKLMLDLKTVLALIITGAIVVLLIVIVPNLLPDVFSTTTIRSTTMSLFPFLQ